jgi:hypothetical protein
MPHPALVSSAAALVERVPPLRDDGTEAVLAREVAGEQRKCFIILGMLRSGTSALMRTLNLLGIDIASDLIEAGRGNERGFWESRQLVKLHDAMLSEAGSRWDDWRRFSPSILAAARIERYKEKIIRILARDYGASGAFAIKDPRICRFSSLYHEILGHLEVAPFYILPVRNPLQVIASLQRGRATMTLGQASLVWLRYNLDAEIHTRGKRRVILSQERFIADWRSATCHIAAVLAFQWPVSPLEAAWAIDEFLTPELVHHRHTPEEVVDHPGLPSWVKQAYCALLILEDDPHSLEARRILDRVREEFEHGAQIFGDSFPPPPPHRSLGDKLRREALRMRRKIGTMLGR